MTKRQVYIINYLGSHAPEFKYAQFLKNAIMATGDVNVEILSDEPDTCVSKAFLVNQYQGGIFSKGISLYRNYRRLQRLISEYPDAVYILIVFGTGIDINFIRIAAIARYHIVDIHHIIENDMDANEIMLYDFAKTYSQRVAAVISHDKDTTCFLEDVGFLGEIFHLPEVALLENFEYDKDHCAENFKDDPESSGIIAQIRSFQDNFKSWLESNNSEH